MHTHPFSADAADDAALQKRWAFAHRSGFPAPSDFGRKTWGDEGYSRDELVAHWPLLSCALSSN